MKLTTRTPPDSTFTQIRGGRILRTLVELVVPRVGIPAEVFGQRHPRRASDTGFITTLAGDLSVEVINDTAGLLLGHYFLSGPAMNTMRYMPEAEGEATAYFREVEGVRVDLDPAHVEGMTEAMAKGDGSHIGWFTSCMLELTHRFDLAYFGNMHVPDVGMFAPASTSILKMYSFSDENRVKRCHLIGSLHCPPARARDRIQGHQPVCYMHCQPPAEASSQACSPFGHELLEGAVLKDVDFWTLDKPAAPAPTIDEAQLS